MFGGFREMYYLCGRKPLNCWRSAIDASIMALAESQFCQTKTDNYMTYASCIDIRPRLSDTPSNLEGELICSSAKIAEGDRFAVEAYDLHVSVELIGVAEITPPPM